MELRPMKKVIQGLEKNVVPSYRNHWLPLCLLLLLIMFFGTACSIKHHVPLLPQAPLDHSKVTKVNKDLQLIVDDSASKYVYMKNIPGSAGLEKVVIEVGPTTESYLLEVLKLKFQVVDYNTGITEADLLSHDYRLVVRRLGSKIHRGRSRVSMNSVEMQLEYSLFDKNKELLLKTTCTGSGFDKNDSMGTAFVGGFYAAFAKDKVALGKAVSLAIADSIDKYLQVLDSYFELPVGVSPDFALEGVEIAGRENNNTASGSQEKSKGEEIDRLAQLLKTGNPMKKLEAAKSLYRHYRNVPEAQTAAYNALNDYLKGAADGEAESSAGAPLVEDAMAHLCNMLGRSGNIVYVDTLSYVEEKGMSRKLRKYAETNLKILKDSF